MIEPAREPGSIGTVERFRQARTRRTRPNLDTTPRLMAVAAVIGTGAGLGAVILIKSLEWVSAGTDALHAALGGSRAFLLLTVPAGIWLAWWLTQRFGPEAAGHGVPQIIAAIRVRAGQIPLKIAPLKTVASALTIGVGGSAGREGPIAQIGAAIGSFAGRRLRLSEPVTRSLIGAGTAAGISATFNAPIAGMLFSLEVVLGSFSASHLSTVVVASLTGAVVSRSVLGEGLTFDVPAYPLSSPWELVLYAAVAVGATAGAYVFLLQLGWWERIADRIPKWMRPVVAGLVVGGIGLLRPEVLGTGQQFIEGLLRNEATVSIGILLAVAVFKAFATSATFAGGGSGGIFMPSLFIGASIGSATAVIAAPYWSLSTLQPGAFALVGMAAAFSAVARAPLTSVLIVFEATGDYGLVLPLMLATLVAMVLADRIHPLSAYTMVLTRLHVPLKPLEVADLLDQVCVADVAAPPSVVFRPDTTLDEAQRLLDQHRLHGAPVLHDGKLVGLLAVTDIRAAGGPSDTVTVADAMTRNPVNVAEDLPVSEAMHRMAALGVGRIPVVAGDDPARLVAMFRREDAVTAYHRAVDAATHRQLEHSANTVRTSSGASFFEFTVPEGSQLVGKTIREVTWPEGCLVVALQRGRQVVVAKGTTQLTGGDRLTCFGTPVRTSDSSSDAGADRTEPRRLGLLERGSARRRGATVTVRPLGASYGFTVTVPVMPSAICTSQTNAKVPGSVKVTSNVKVSVVGAPESGIASSWKLTLWRPAPIFENETVSPTLTVISDGSKVLSSSTSTVTTPAAAVVVVVSGAVVLLVVSGAAVVVVCWAAVVLVVSGAAVVVVVSGSAGVSVVSGEPPQAAAARAINVARATRLRRMVASFFPWRNTHARRA